jgi:hypothetical protein
VIFLKKVFAAVLYLFEEYETKATIDYSLNKKTVFLDSSETLV